MVAMFDAKDWKQELEGHFADEAYYISNGSKKDKKLGFENDLVENDVTGEMSKASSSSSWNSTYIKQQEMARNKREIEFFAFYDPALKQVVAKFDQKPVEVQAAWLEHSQNKHCHRYFPEDYDKKNKEHWEQAETKAAGEWAASCGIS